MTGGDFTTGSGLATDSGLATGSDLATDSDLATGPAPAPRPPRAEAAAAPAWLLHEHAILRSTGFPFALLELLEFPRTADIADQIVTAEERITAAVGAVVTQARAVPRSELPPSVAKAVRKALTRRGPVRADVQVPGSLAAPLREYADALDHHDRLLTEARQEAEREAADCHRALARLTDTDQRLLEALWASSPGMYESGLRQLRAAAAAPGAGRARTLRRQLAGYLQRLCAKNETTSFFGPIEYADYAEPAAGRPRTGPVRDRAPRIASWAVVSLADQVSADDTVRALLPVHRAPSVALRDGRVSVAGRPVAAPPEHVRLLGRLDEAPDCRQLARELGAPVTDVLGTVDELRRRRLAVPALRPPATEIDALGWLCSALAGLPVPDDLRLLLERLRAIESELARASFDRKRALLTEAEQRISAATGAPARRGGGEWYADRLVIREECVGPMTPLHLGHRVQQQLRADLAPALDLLAGEAVARHRALTAALLDRVPALRTGRPMPLLELLALDLDGLTVEPEPTPSRRWIEAQLAESGAGGDKDGASRGPARVVIDPARLPRPELTAEPLFGSPDVMFCTSDPAELLAGTAPLVLAESHDSMILWGWALQLHPDADAVRAAGAELLRAAVGPHRLGSMIGTRRTKIVPFRFPGPAVDAGGAEPDAIPIAEVSVRLVDGRLACVAGDGVPFLLHNGGLSSPVHNALSPPRLVPVPLRAPGDAPGDPGHTPRITLGRTVLQRERWRLPPDELFPLGPAGHDEAELLAHAARTARRLGLPRRLFLIVPGERKPVMLDLRSPALLDLGRHLSAGREAVTVSEMLPGPDQLWLDGPDGRHCSELRITVARRQP
jgi:Lantibiotic dehydratase, N terminus